MQAVSEDGIATDRYVRKALYSYGWDWGPCFVNEGIWKEVHLVTWDNARIEQIHRASTRQADRQARLALATRNIVYGEKVQYEGPLFRKVGTQLNPDGSYVSGSTMRMDSPSAASCRRIRACRRGPRLCTCGRTHRRKHGRVFQNSPASDVCSIRLDKRGHEQSVQRGWPTNFYLQFRVKPGTLNRATQVRVIASDTGDWLETPIGE